MTSKEALASIAFSMRYRTTPKYVYKVESNSFKIVEQALDRLEKLEKVFKILRKELKFIFIDEQQKIVIDDSISWDMLNISLSEEDYNLLKEELKQ